MATVVHSITYLKVIDYIFVLLVRGTVTSRTKSTDTSTVLGPFM